MWRCFRFLALPAAALPAAALLAAALPAAAPLAAFSGAGHAREAGRIDLSQTGWKVFTPPGKRPARFLAYDDGVIEVRAEGAVSFLYKDLAAPGPEGARLAWRWRVERSIMPRDLGAPGLDDRPLAVHVWFPKPPGERTFRDFVQGLFGFPAIGHAITYVWGGTAARGEVLANPHLKNAALIVLRSGDSRTGVWFAEAVDPLADFERLFGRPPASAPRTLVISADTDDGGETAVGWVSEPRLIAPASRRGS